MCTMCGIFRTCRCLLDHQARISLSLTLLYTLSARILIINVTFILMLLVSLPWDEVMVGVCLLRISIEMAAFSIENSTEKSGHFNRNTQLTCRCLPVGTLQLDQIYRWSGEPRCYHIPHSPHF